ncbi:SUMF1/EgtB/PvdO family nonheme iron enzyme [Cryobacterium tepidiphilum]|uniref:Sulfatase-modifying factor enzyme-like domain-containing protein n=1 Tax=Cryobacterium tepidiphilum TaxID=2486026 RepID=A0A3M8LC52_9MICO|nr:SUMF1/EgtB/PvdO family nonheme iron enzyme [Cryobacterium tepidiphilum]RNE62244.1 hypothetical protein EEJ31_08430 [Cryobacterium tepidiphilum]
MNSFDPDEANTNEINPLVPRAIDLPTVLPLDGTLDAATGDIAKIFAAPTDPAEWPAWRDALASWRREARRRLAYSGREYDRDDHAWTRSCYSVALVWLWDERLFDRDAQRFTPDRLLSLTADHGGFDGIVLWHAYPVIGIDDRNQYDYYRDVPGLADLVADFQSRGLKVFIDYNPWDTGTRRPANDDPEELALLVGELRVDGVFLDTMKEGDSRLIDALHAADPPQVLEGESRVPNQRIEDHLLSWAQWFADSEAPGVMRAHWYERRHMLHSTRRWNRDHSGELQSAWMNGTGMLVWDTVFGVWVGWNARDTSTLRRMLRVQRALNDVLVNGDWSPLSGAAPEALAARVYVSRYSHGPLTLWTIVNRGTEDYHGPLIAEAPSGARLYDVTAGHALPGGSTTVPARSVTGVLAVRGDEPDWLGGLLAAAAGDEFDADDTFPARDALRLAPGTSRDRMAPAGAVVIEAGERTLEVRYRRRETGMYAGAPYVEEWKPLPPRLHDDRTERIRVDQARTAVAATEVTRAEFLAFAAATGYRPVCTNRFLVESDGDGAATWLDLDDARAYAAWAGARLPTEFEWQIAAADPRFRRSERWVWNWTESEHSDGITRFVMLKGGSDHASLGSDWYVDGGRREPEFSLKFLLAGLGLDRSPNIGFRLAWDLTPGSD